MRARDAGIAGLEFLRSIPGTVGGFVRMNGGAYGGEVKDILVDCDVVLRSASLPSLPVNATVVAATINALFEKVQLLQQDAEKQ